MEVVQDTSIEQLKAFIKERYGESEDTQKLEFEGKPISYLFGKTKCIFKSPRSFHPGLGWLLCFQFISAAAATSTTATTTFASHVKIVCAKPYMFGTKNYRSGEMYWMASYIPLSHAYHLIRFWWNSVGKFFPKILDVFFQGQTYYWPYLRNGWSNRHEMKRKCMSWIIGKVCDLDLWCDPWTWPWILSWSNFEKAISQGLLVIDVKQKLS